MKEKKKYSPWVNILKKHISKEAEEEVVEEKVSEKEEPKIWSPPIPPNRVAKEMPDSKEDKELLGKLEPAPNAREALYWKLHKEYYNAHLDILSDEDRRTVSEQPDSILGKKFHAKVKAEVDKAVDYQLNFLR